MRRTDVDYDFAIATRQPGLELKRIQREGPMR
jgi:hypothetical protein